MRKLPADRKTLTAKQLKIAKEVGVGIKESELIAKHRLSDNTIQRWMQIDAFRAAVEDAEAAYMESLFPKATRELEAELEHPDPWIRANAVRIVQTVKEAAKDRASRMIVPVFAYMPAPGSPPAIRVVTDAGDEDEEEAGALPAAGDVR